MPLSGGRAKDAKDAKDQGRLVGRRILEISERKARV